MGSSIEHVTIVGPGGVGGFMAVVMARAGVEVALFGRPDAPCPDVLALTSPVFGSATMRPTWQTDVASSTGAIIVATKAYQLQEAATTVAESRHPGVPVIPLQNGVGHLEQLRTDLGDPIVAGTIGAIEVEAVSPGLIEHRSQQTPLIELARTPEHAHHVDRVTAMLRSAGLRVEHRTSEAAVVWAKLARLAPVSTMTAAAQRPLGEILLDPTWRDQLIRVVEETCTVATTDGFPIVASQVMKQIRALPPGLTTSLQRDIARGGPTELDNITGGVLRRATDYGLSCPTLAIAYAELSRTRPSDASKAR